MVKVWIFLWWVLKEPSFSKNSLRLALKPEYTILNAFSCNLLMFLLRVLEWNVQISGQKLNWDSIRLSRLMWLAMRWRALCFLLTLFHILLIYPSNFNSESKVIPSSFSLRLNVIYTLLEGTTRCTLELNRTWRFPGLAFTWLLSDHLKILLAILWSSVITEDISSAQE